MSLGMNPQIQSPGYPGEQYAGSGQFAAAPPFQPGPTQFMAGGRGTVASPPEQTGSPGVVALVGQTLRSLDEIYNLTGRALEGQLADPRQALWQVQQLANQARSYSYQIRGMLWQ